MDALKTFTIAKPISQVPDKDRKTEVRFTAGHVDREGIYRIAKKSAEQRRKIEKCNGVVRTRGSQTESNRSWKSGSANGGFVRHCTIRQVVELQDLLNMELFIPTLEKENKEFCLRWRIHNIQQRSTS